MVIFSPRAFLAWMSGMRNNRSGWFISIQMFWTATRIRGEGLLWRGVLSADDDFPQ